MKVRVSIELLQTAFFRDSRPFDAKTDSEGQTIFPSPITFFGIISSYYLDRTGKTFGDFVVNGDDKLGKYDPDLKSTGIRITGQAIEHSGTMFFPPPANLFYSAGRRRAHVLKPVEEKTPGIKWDIDEGGVLPLTLPEPLGPTQPAPLDWMINQEGLASFLSDDIENSLLFAYLKDESRIFVMEPRFGHVRSELSRTVEEGFSFSTTHLRPVEYPYNGVVESFRFVSAIEGLSQAELLPDGSHPVGGEGRLAMFKSNDMGPGEKLFPEADEVLLKIKERKRFFLYSMTPSIFFDGWRRNWSTIPEFNQATMVGASVNKPYIVSGWQRDGIGAGGTPRPVLKVVPSGSVYFFTADKWDDGEFEIVYKNYHCAKSISDLYPNAGFGITLVGAW